MKNLTPLLTCLKTWLSVAFLATLSLAACQSTQPPSPDQTASKTGEARFNAADTNHDGKLSRDEASDYLVNQTFEGLDTNHDGQISEKEWTTADPSTLPQFKKRDANGDGVVTKDEAIAYGRKSGVANSVVKEADKDGDGQLSYPEIKAYYASREGPAN